MGITEEITALNQRLDKLRKSRDEAKTALAVELHKVKEIEAQLKELGVEVDGKTDAELETMLDETSDMLASEKERLDQFLSEAEAKFRAFQDKSLK